METENPMPAPRPRGPVLSGWVLALVAGLLLWGRLLITQDVPRTAIAGPSAESGKRIAGPSGKWQADSADAQKRKPGDRAAVGLEATGPHDTPKAPSLQH